MTGVSEKNFTVLISILNIVFGLLAAIAMSVAAFALNSTTNNAKNIAVMETEVRTIQATRFTDGDAERLRAEFTRQYNELDKRLSRIETGIEILLEGKK